MRLSALLVFTLFCLICEGQTAPTLVLLHGKVWTGNSSKPEVQAVAIAGNRILQVGTDAEIQKIVGPQTQVIDLQGRRVLPGFNDAHVHFIDAADALTGVHLQDAASPEEFRNRIASFAKKCSVGEWITHGNWSTEKWPYPERLHHSLIDDVTPQNPVAVWSVDGHSVLANAIALRLAHIGADTPDVPGGVIVRDAAGQPTGVLRDAATNLVMRVMSMTDIQMDQAIVAGDQYAVEHGVTSVQTLAGYVMDDRQMRFYGALKRAERDGRLHVRVSVFPFLSNQEEDAAEARSHNNGLVKVVGVKAFADGSMGSHTAWLSKPYSDEPGTTGMPSAEMQNRAQMLKEIEAADAAGLIVAVHAIGDKAIKETLDVFELAQKANPGAPHKFRLEHAQLMRSDDVKKAAKLHVIASMQPQHYAGSKAWAGKRLGTERAARLYPWNSILQAGIPLAFGSDWPVAPMIPLQGIYVATTRPDAEKTSVEEAVRAYTLGAATAEGQKEEKGTISAGKFADIIVLSNDIFHEDPSKIENTEVEITIFNGKIVYRR